MNLIDALRHHRGHRVTLAFTDGGAEAGGTLTAVHDVGTIDVEYGYDHGGRRRHYTVRYTLTGDADTPAVTAVTRMPEQADALFDLESAR